MRKTNTPPDANPDPLTGELALIPWELVWALPQGA
jgi:hypothetical protein